MNRMLKETPGTNQERERFRNLALGPGVKRKEKEQGKNYTIQALTRAG